MGGGIRPAQAKGPWVGRNAPVPPPDMDIMAKVSATDTTTDYLQEKIVVASGLTIGVLSPGGDEQLQIALDSTIANNPLYASLVKDGDTPYVRTSSETYEVLGMIDYPGSAVVGTITKITAIATCLTSGKFSDVRIYDVTNGNIMAELLNVSGDAFSIVDLGAISSIPAAGAILEIQGRVAAVDGDDLLISGFELSI